MYPSLQYHTEYFFTALKILCALPVHPSLLPNHWQPVLFLSSLYFYLFQNVMQVGSYCTVPLHIGFFGSVQCIQCIFIFFHGLIAHFFFVMNKTLLSDVTVCLWIHLLKFILVASKFSQFWIKLQQILCIGLCMDTNFHLFGINTKKHNCWNHMIRVYLLLSETGKLSSKVTVLHACQQWRNVHAALYLC